MKVIKKNKESIHWLEFELLQQYDVDHAVFLKPYSTLDLFSRWQKIKPHSSLAKIADAQEVHGNRVISVDSNYEKATCDGLSTKDANLGLVILHADCQAALFFDPVRHVIANVHCGWRGSTNNIYLETIEHLHSQYGCQAKDLIVCIGPSLGPQSAEFIHYRDELPPKFWKFQLKPQYFDFWAISRWQLKECGILAQNIELAQIDTYSDPTCYSWRGEKTALRHETLIMVN